MAPNLHSKFRVGAAMQPGLSIVCRRPSHLNHFRSLWLHDPDPLSDSRPNVESVAAENSPLRNRIARLLVLRCSGVWQIRNRVATGTGSTVKLFSVGDGGTETVVQCHLNRSIPLLKSPGIRFIRCLCRFQLSASSAPSSRTWHIGSLRT